MRCAEKLCGNGLDQLIFYDFFGKYVPFASKDKLVQQLPSLKKKFLNNKAKIKAPKKQNKGVNFFNLFLIYIK